MEVEFTPKSKDNFLKILKRNYFDYDMQIWVVPKKEAIIKRRIKESGYADVKIMEWEMIEESVRKFL